MRLTLRTLLAYRDGVLDPKDAAVLEAKIADSSTAQQISKRISDEMQNRRLAPIPVDAREFGFEANLVAEFLDDTIPMETLPEMERKCLENNTLLSEIGSCHQILSRALSIPSPIPSSLRQRIHELPNRPKSVSFSDSAGRTLRIDPASSFGEVKPDPQNGAPMIPAKSVRKDNGELRGSGIELNDGLGRQVPEYLIGSDRGWLRTAVTGMLLLLALVVAGSFAIGPIDRVRDLLRKSDNALVDLNKADESKSMAPVAEPIEPAAPTVALPSKPSDAPEESAPGEKKSSASDSAMPTLPVDTAKPTANLNANSSKDSAADREADRAKVDINSSATQQPLNTKNRIQWLPDTKPSSEAIVLKLASEKKDSLTSWTRMNPGEFAHHDERIVVPPCQRTELRLEPGIRLLCAGENDLEVVANRIVPKCLIRSGRVLVFATPDAKELEVDCNGLLVSLRFASSDSSCALDIQTLWSSTSDEALQSGTLQTNSHVRLYGVQGVMAYSSKHANGSVQGNLNVGQYLEWIEGKSTEVREMDEAPWWFSDSTNRDIDKAAASDLQQALTGKSSGVLESVLHKLTTSRQSETAALAVRTKMMLGQYDDLFATDGPLSRKNMRTHRQSLIAQIPQSLWLEKHRAEFIHAIQKDAPSRMNLILRLLIPPSQEQLSAGADKLLVDTLASPMLDERVLAIHQLKNIVGKTLGYDPDRNQIESIQQWQKMLGKKELRYPELTAPPTESAK